MQNNYIGTMKLCQNRVSIQNSVRSMVVAHVGGKKCTNLTLFAQELFNSIIGVKPKQELSMDENTKRKQANVANSELGKIERVDITPLNLRRTQRSHLLTNINNSIDDIFSLVSDLRAISLILLLGSL